MMLRNIAAVIDNGDLDDGFIQDALAFAGFHDAHLTFLVVSPSIPTEFALLPDLSYFDLAGPETRAKAKAKRIEAESGHARVEVRIVGDDPDRVIGSLTLQARYTDLVLFGGPQTYGNIRFRRHAAETIALASGRPVFLVPPGMTSRKWDHIVVGWNASPEATRALHEAIAWVEPGAKIDIAIVNSRPANAVYRGDLHGPEPGADISRHLARHGYAVDVHVLETDGDEVSDELMRLTRTRGADLLVIGVIAHSGLHKFTLGGVTSDLLHEASVPVLLAH